MKTFKHSGFDVRLIDMRPESQKIQLNIFNQENSGHSYCALINIETVEESVSLDDIFSGFAASGFVDEFISKAQMAFATPSPQDN